MYNLQSMKPLENNNMKLTGNGKKTNKKQVMVKLKINIWTVVFGILLLFFFLPPIFSLLGIGSPVSTKIDLSVALNDIKNEKVEKVVIEKDNILLTYKDGKNLTAVKEEGESFADLLQKSEIDPTKINFSITDQTLAKALAEILGIVLPIILLGGLFLYMMKSQTKGAQDIFSFGRSKAKIFAKGKQSITFADVAGVDEAKKELVEVVDFLKNPEKYRKIGARTPKGVLLFGPSGVGKCVIGDSLVSTSKGLLEIRDIPKYFSVEENGFVHGATLSSFDFSNSIDTIAKASHWYDLGISDTLKLQTYMGHEIEGTLEHPLVFINDQGKLEFKRLDQAKVGDWIPVKTNNQMFGNYKVLDTKTSYLLGLLTGDGGMSIKDRIYFSTADKELLLFFKTYFKNKFEYSIKKANSKYDYYISSSNIKSEITHYGMDESYSRNKKIPDQIMLSPKENVVAFLQGLFDTDGSVYKTGKVEYSTSSKKLARQVSALLLNLGVMHKFREKGDNQYSSSYVILISGTSLINFTEQIGFRLKRKQDKLDLYLSKIKLRTNVDLFPLQGPRIKKIWRYLVENGKKPSKFVDENFHKQICRYADNGRRPSRESLNLFLKACERSDPEIFSNEDYRYLKLLTNSGLFFDRVKKLKKSENRVYDFTVPKTHSFIANGFISHNTLLAKAVAGEANVPFFSMAGSEFMEMLVGIGASRVRDLFAQAKASAPSIIFIDEIDAIGRQRGRSGFVGGHDEREQTLNQILVEMDGFTPNESVMVLAATNRGDLLDPALLRPGRFDRRVTLDMPDKEGRGAIMKIHARGKRFGKEINWEKIADRTVGFSGADLENMLNEAAIQAAREEKSEIDMLDVEEAATKVKLGPAKKRLQSKEDKKITAYHEAGHAIVTNFTPGMDPVHRISIVARGMSLGHTLIPPAADRTHDTKTRLVNQITAMLGGRAAEEFIFNEMTSGASNDIANATRIARAMVVEWGMSNLGPINFGPDSSTGEFGQTEWYEQNTVSPAMQEKIDNEIKRIMDNGLKEAEKIIKKHKAKLDEVALALLDKETIDKEEFEKIVGKKQTENGL
ncbi:MAG: ATP-dependent zinc metalloprotease FtsH [Candidatus Woesebacteria bacterium GW2011_GWC1_30_29]|uniref:ATP-dependent zinc metalloprotease FtsH n=1 Tax=Candidatus Woesebacteria bacterium GW2011_GWC2_31_9 TaxID=1618586 RepID=A0A0G0AYI8_9BACT|nr:MAG: ATP-dependent zinc metalloprotease FtsH [Candidatus Woesebacteria bacterium GW2011_GWC1_30_29]KKP26813.1 MAG: ATP-dependent zinc metalloprotease FtsH [Candidatus Woesebacteria bacterium GW2011_GWD1_31_12]KKP27388.1 MAG: ATP-dependent zinc metalloprotease FtsH [Candidatus Woesebacteria bacterium GW2011_GWB1_31_29]KKP31585.1 MAG: ATP-dependent zinc metalloprotease FtsH [Candidatus Woesebacteria bacterium GW2011_GWC2_31_9]KKP33754.1 MAG: ATP-dependent zinc metalloprotease FtsH [Candidatus 